MIRLLAFAATHPRLRRSARLLIALPWLLLPTSAHAVAVTSPAELTLGEFWVFAEGSNGAFARIDLKGPSPRSINIDNPVIDGVTIDGHLIVENERKATGAATAVNVVLNHAGPEAIDTTLDVGSFVTYDLAVFSSSVTSAQVQVVGSGIGGAAKGTGGPGNSYSLASGYITIYSTSPTGQIQTPLYSWDVRDNMTGVTIDEVVTLDTNELYKVIIRSTANIKFNMVSSFDQYAYMYVDPIITSLTEGAEVAISENAPEPSAVAATVASLLALAAVAARRTVARS